MKINFEQLKVYADIAHKHPLTTDVREQLAEALYQCGHGIAHHALAMKIYNTHGECDIDEQEYAIIMAFVEQNSTPMLIDAFRLYGEKKEEQ